MTTLLLIHAAATLLMTGVVIFVAIVHYPLFGAVGPECFPAYSAAHASRTTIVVAPLMLIEALTGVLLLVPTIAGRDPGVLEYAGLGLLAPIWGITFLLNVPQHARLAKCFDTGIHRALLLTHALRTLLWAARGVIVMVMIAKTGR